jgi:hypothetical protein
MKNWIITLGIVLTAFSAFSQCETYYNKINCRPSPQEAKDMVLSSQSKGVMLEAQQTYTFQITLFRNMDYRIIFCAPRKFLPIHYVLTEKESGSVLFDNKDDDYIESIGFTTENTMIVEVKVTLLAKGAKFSDFRDNRTCFGMPILYRKVPKLGS